MAADLSQYEPIFQAAGTEWNVDPTLLKAVAAQESGGNASAVSSKNAQGLMQIVPDTQKLLGITDPTDPVQSIYGAAKYLSAGLDAEGSPQGALLYYHGGPNWRQSFGPESAAYVPGVARYYGQFSKSAQPDAPQPSSSSASPAPTPAAPQGPLIVGDSLASKGGLGGSGVVGASPAAVLSSIQNLDPAQVNGRDVILSSGASNNPASAGLLEGQIKALNDKGARSVNVVGVGNSPKLDGVNDTLSATAAQNGARFVPIDPATLGPDGVHPTTAGYKALLAAATPTPTPATTAVSGSTMASDADILKLLPPAPQVAAPSAAPATPSAAAPTSDSDILKLLPAAPTPAPPKPPATPPLTSVLASPEAQNADMPAGTAPPSSQDIVTALQPAPNTTYGDILPLARDDTTGQLRLAMPNMLRAPLLGLTTQGPQINPQTGSLTVPGATINPDTGTLGITPEAAAVAPFALRGPMFSGENALMRDPVSPLTLTKPPPVTAPELKAAISRAGEPPPVAPAPPDIEMHAVSPTAAAEAPLQSGAALAVTPGAPPAVTQATPPALVGITPGEAAAYRSTTEGQKLLENQPPGVADTTQYIPGVTPNQAELEQTVNAAREIKSLGIGNTEASQAAKEAANANNVARTEYWNDTVGSPVDQFLERQARTRDIQAAEPQVFSPDNVTGPFDPTPVVQRIDDIMSQPKNLENSQMKAVLPDIRARLVDANGNPLITDPAQAWGLRQDIDRMTSARMAQADPNPHYVAHELSTVADAIDGKINDVAPGYQDMINQYAAHSRNLDQMQVLSDASPSLFRGPNQTMGYNDFQRFMKGVVDARSTPSTDLNPYKSITDDTMQRLWNLRDDLRRSAGAQELAKAPGSDTVPNVIDALKQYAKLGGAGMAENAISYLFPIGGPMITRGLRAALAPVMEGRAAAAQTARMQQMLNPQNRLTAPQPPNQLAPPGAP